MVRAAVLGAPRSGTGLLALETCLWLLRSWVPKL